MVHTRAIVHFPSNKPVTNNEWPSELFIKTIAKNVFLVAFFIFILLKMEGLAIWLTQNVCYYLTVE